MAILRLKLPFLCENGRFSRAFSALFVRFYEIWRVFFARCASIARVAR